MTRWLQTKAALAGTGLGLGIAGMALEAPALVWVAIALLAAAFLVRLIERRALAAQPSLPPTPEGDR